MVTPENAPREGVGKMYMLSCFNDIFIDIILIEKILAHLYAHLVSHFLVFPQAVLSRSVN